MNDNVNFGLSYSTGEHFPYRDESGWASIVSGGVSPPIDLKRKLEEDGLGYQAICASLSRWVSQQAEIVDEIALSYNGTGYSLSILVTLLQDPFVSEVYRRAPALCLSFGNFQPIVYLLGPRQRESPMLRAVDSLNVKCIKQ